LQERPYGTEEVLKLKDPAALLRVGEKTVYSMAQAGELSAFKVRGSSDLPENISMSE